MTLTDRSGQKTATLNTTVGAREFSSLCDQYDLIDVFTHLHPDKQSFTHLSKAHKTYTRIDKIFVSISLLHGLEREMFYLTTHSTHFIYGYMASDIWLRTILIVRKETRCRHIGYSYRLTARFFLYAPSHRQDNTYHGLWYTSRGALAGARNSSMGPPHEGSIRRPTAP